MLCEGHWKNVDATSTLDEKHQIVSEAWHILEQRGVDAKDWAEFLRWRGEAGMESGNSKPRPAQANKHEPNHKPRFENGKGGGKSMSKRGGKGGGKGTVKGKKGKSMSRTATR